MTIDEAINHAQEVAQTCENNQCALDHAEWLIELKTIKEVNNLNG